MIIDYVYGALVYDKKYVGVRSMDIEGKSVDIEIDKLKGRAKEFIKQLHVLHLQEHGDLLLTEEELNDKSKMAYDGSEDGELVESVRQYLSKRQAQVDTKSDFNVIVSLTKLGSTFKLAGIVNAEDADKARKMAHSHCMNNFNVESDAVRVLDVAKLKTNDGNTAFNKTRYAKLKKAVCIVDVRIPVHDPDVGRDILKQFSSEFKVASPKEAEFEAIEYYMSEMKVPESDIQVVGVRIKK